MTVLRQFLVSFDREDRAREAAEVLRADGLDVRTELHGHDWNVSVLADERTNVSEMKNKLKRVAAEFQGDFIGGGGVITVDWG